MITSDVWTTTGGGMSDFSSIEEVISDAVRTVGIVDGSLILMAGWSTDSSIAITSLGFRSVTGSTGDVSLIGGIDVMSELACRGEIV
jgi:hypothetical protein